MRKKTRPSLLLPLFSLASRRLTGDLRQPRRPRARRRRLAGTRPQLRRRRRRLCPPPLRRARGRDPGNELLLAHEVGLVGRPAALLRGADDDGGPRGRRRPRAVPGHGRGGDLGLPDGDRHRRRRHLVRRLQRRVARRAPHGVPHGAVRGRAGQHAERPARALRRGQDDDRRPGGRVRGRLRVAVVRALGRRRRGRARLPRRRAGGHLRDDQDPRQARDAPVAVQLRRDRVGSRRHRAVAREPGSGRASGEDGAGSEGGEY